MWILMTGDLCNDVAALLPVLILAKITDRFRRHNMGHVLGSIRWHRVFIGAALLGEVRALAGAAWISSGHASGTWSNWFTVPLALNVVLCIGIFAREIMASDTSD
jgi:hypothetical protein